MEAGIVIPEGVAKIFVSNVSSLLNSAADVAKLTPLCNFLLRIWDFIQDYQ